MKHVVLNVNGKLWAFMDATINFTVVRDENLQIN